MNDVNSLRFMLHVSDFHLTDTEEELKFARAALKKLTDTLKEQKIKNCLSFSFEERVGIIPLNPKP